MSLEQKITTPSTHDTVNLDKLILVGIGKLFSEYSTYIIGELKQKQKYEFNLAVKAVENFAKEIENKIDNTNAQNLELIMETLVDGVVQMRNDIIKNW